MTEAFHRVIGRTDKIQFQHGCALGGTGSGKTVFSMFYLQLHFLKGYCCVYVDMGRCDGFTLPIPESNPEMLKRISISGQGQVRPRGFPVKVYVPLIRKDASKDYIEEELPEFFQPFRIAMSELSSDDLLILLGDVSPGAEAVLRLMLKKMKFTSLEALLAQLSRLQSHREVLLVGEAELKVGSALTSLIRVLSDLQETGLICSDTEKDYRFDIDALMQDNQNIHVLSLYDVDDYRLRYMIGAFFFRKLYDTRRKKQFDKKVFLYIDEATLWCPSTPKLAPLSWKDNGVMETITNIARQGRAVGIKCWFAIQRWNELHPSARANVDQLFVFRCNEDELKSIFESVGRIPMNYYYNILSSLPKAQPGVGLRLWRNANAFRYPDFSMPSMAHSLKPLEDSFVLLRKHGIQFKVHKVLVRGEFNLKVGEQKEKEKKVPGQAIELSFEQEVKKYIFGLPIGTEITPRDLSNAIHRRYERCCVFLKGNFGLLGLKRIKRKGKTKYIKVQQQQQ